MYKYILLLITIMITPCMGIVSFSGDFYNGHDTLSMSTSLTDGSCQMDMLMIPEGMMCGAFHDISMHEAGYSIGNSSESVRFTTPQIDYTESFVSIGRDTKWQNSINSMVTWHGYNGFGINTEISSKAI